MNRRPPLGVVADAHADHLASQHHRRAVDPRRGDVCVEDPRPLLLNPLRLPLEESDAFGPGSAAGDRDAHVAVVADADNVATGTPDSDELD